MGERGGAAAVAALEGRRAGGAPRCRRKSILHPIPTIGVICNLQFSENGTLRRVQFCCDSFGEPSEVCRISSGIDYKPKAQKGSAEQSCKCDIN